jgi:hypothetical protein
MNASGEVAGLEATAFAIGASVRSELAAEVAQALAQKGRILGLDLQGFIVTRLSRGRVNP